MTWKLFLDDERRPNPADDFVVAASFNQAVKLVRRKGAPVFVDFDFNLGNGNEKNGLDFARWLIKKDREGNGVFLPVDFAFNCHSASPDANVKIERAMSEYLRSRRPA